jgi:hypothetical protein
MVCEAAGADKAVGLLTLLSASRFSGPARPFERGLAWPVPSDLVSFERIENRLKSREKAQ